MGQKWQVGEIPVEFLMNNLSIATNYFLSQVFQQLAGAGGRKALLRLFLLLLLLL